MVEMQMFHIPKNYKERIFFVVAVLYDKNGRKISDVIYWPRTILQMEDYQYYQKFVSEPVAWPTLSSGPWLKPVVAKNKTSLEVTDIKLKSFQGGRGIVSFTVRNIGENPSFMTRLEMEGVGRIFFASDNYFFLESNEMKSVEMEFVIREDKPVNQFKLVIGGWNTKSITKTVKL
jgi:beta-mannosidase